MIFNHGGGTSLNFRIVRYKTEEALLTATPAENTIGVVLDQISSWMFAADAPEDPSDYMVWFRTGTASAVSFNALKKNGITIYPISAMQYVGGVWTDVTAKSYQGGEWVDWWNGELYVSGDEYEAVTGGWVFSHDGENTGSYMRLGSDTANSNENKYAQTANMIPLAGRSLIEVHFTGGRMQFSGSKLNIEAVDSSGGIAATATVLSGTQNSIPETTGQLVVSGLDGDYYVRVVIYWDSGSNAANVEYADFDKVVCK